jgi:hypothetical protein
MGWVYLSDIDENIVTDQLHGSKVSLARRAGLVSVGCRSRYVLFTQRGKPISQSKARRAVGCSA